MQVLLKAGKACRCQECFRRARPALKPFRPIPPAAYCFGWIRVELDDGAGYLIALPEQALFDWLYRSLSVRSATALAARRFEDIRLDGDHFRDLDQEQLAQYAQRMLEATFRVHLPGLLGRGV